MIKYDKKLIIMSSIIIVIVILAILGLTYAFFVANVEGNQNATNTVIETADLRLVYNDTQIISIEEALPGASATKEFMVTNIGNAKVYYDINIMDVINTFISGDLIYSLTSTNNGGTVTNISLPTTDEVLLEGIEIEPGIVQTYTMTIKFKETGTNQNANQGAQFAGKLQINASKLISDEVVFGIEETVGQVAITKSKSVNLVGLYYGNVTCESEDENIAECTATKDKIDIEGKAAGETEIVVTESAKSLAVRYNVEVLDVILGLEETSGVVEKSTTKNINITGSDYGTLSCETSDASKATCNITGTTLNITGVNTGMATITLIESIMNKTASYNITIKDPSIYNKIITDNTPISDTSINFANASSSSNGLGLYYTSNLTYSEENTLTYYYRGAVTNNWVSFGGFLWRIVRTTSEGGTKLVYSGNGSGTSSGIIGTSAFNTYKDNKYYTGYTYNLSGYSSTQTNSEIKKTIDNWYNTNLSTYSNYLSETAIYCNDTSSGRVSGNFTYYPAYDRTFTSKKPTYVCQDINNARYTVSTSTGNGYLQNPIAMLTVDELMFSGLSSAGITNSYMIDNAIAWWWVMNPAYYNSTYNGTGAGMHVVHTNSSISSSPVNILCSPRPSTALKQCIIVTGGDGTQANPYVVSDSNCS